MRNRGCKYPENYQGRKEWMSLFFSEQEVPHEEFHSFKLFEIIAFSEYSICLIILGQDASPGPSSGSWDGKSKFSVIHVTELIKFFSQKLNLLRSLYLLPIKWELIFISKCFYHSYLWVGCMGFLRQIALWWAGKDTRACRKDHLWPGLVQTQRSGLSPKQVAHC